jgi:hypothetical protein
MLDISVFKQPACPPVACRGTDSDHLRQVRIREPTVALEQAQYLQVDPV